MSMPWSAFLEVFQSGLFWLTQFYGGHLASAIIAFSLLIRVAILPLTLRMALRSRAHARRLKALRPELLRLKERHAEDPRRQMEETLAVYRRNGVTMVDFGVLKGAVLQMPVVLGLFHAIRTALASRSAEQGFLWVASLARPDLIVAVVAGVLMGAGAALGSSQPRPGAALTIPVVATVLVAMFTSAGFGLYLASSGLVATLQGLLVRRSERHAPESRPPAA